MAANAAVFNDPLTARIPLLNIVHYPPGPGLTGDRLAVNQDPNGRCRGGVAAQRLEALQMQLVLQDGNFIGQEAWEARSQRDTPKPDQQQPSDPGTDSRPQENQTAAR